MALRFVVVTILLVAVCVTALPISIHSGHRLHALEPFTQWDSKIMQSIGRQSNSVETHHSRRRLRKRQGDDDVPVYRHRQPWIRGLWGADRVHALGNCYVDEGMKLPLSVTKYENAVTHCLIRYRNTLEKAEKITPRPPKVDTILPMPHPPEIVPSKLKRGTPEGGDQKCDSNNACQASSDTTWHEMWIDAMKPLENGRETPNDALHTLAVNDEDYQVVRYMIDTLAMHWDYALALLAYWKDLDYKAQSTLVSEKPLMVNKSKCRLWPWSEKYECIID